MSSSESIDDICIVSVKDKKKNENVRKGKKFDLEESIKSSKENDKKKIKCKRQKCDDSKKNIEHKISSKVNFKQNGMVANQCDPEIYGDGFEALMNCVEKVNEPVPNKAAVNEVLKSNEKSVEDTKKTTIIIIKINEQDFEYEIERDENFINLYKFLFGDNKQSKLIYKNTQVSKFTNLKGINYDFDEKHYFTVKGDVTIKMKESIEIKVNYAFNKSSGIEISNKSDFNELIQICNEKFGIKSKFVFINGKIMKNNERICDVIEENDIIDLISI